MIVMPIEIGWSSLDFLAPVYHSPVMWIEESLVPIHGQRHEAEGSRCEH
jgi:hypothetical protein